MEAGNTGKMTSYRENPTGLPRNHDFQLLKTQYVRESHLEVRIEGLESNVNVEIKQVWNCHVMRKKEEKNRDLSSFPGRWVKMKEQL